MAGERAVGSFDSDPGARPQAGRRPALVAEPLDGDPDVGRPGQGGQRVRVPLPPQLPGEEMPQEELAARYGQPVQVPSPADHRDDPRRLGADLDDPELVPQAPPDRLRDPEHDDHPRGGRPDRDPQRPDQRMADEGDAGEDLVGERQSQPQVQVQVDDPPRLVLDPAPDLPVGRDRGHDQQAEPGRRRQHVPVGRQQHPQLVPRPGAGRPRVAEHDQDDMGRDEADRPGGNLPVPADELILAGRALQPRQPRHEHHHDQHEVRPGEAGEPAGRGQQPARRGQRAPGLAEDDRGKDGAEAEPGQRGARVHDPGARRRSRARRSFRVRTLCGDGNRPGSETCPPGITRKSSPAQLKAPSTQLERHLSARA